MNETLSLALALAAAFSLGAIFFGGLWWTVRKGVSSKQPALWFLGSLLLRTWLVLAGFYFVGRGIGSGCWRASLDLSSRAWS
jgi:F1F0 ATPase subunit 2